MKRIIEEQVDFSSPYYVRTTVLLKKLEAYPHLSGYHYAREAIVFLAKCNPQELVKICTTKTIYPMVAQKYETTPTCVERGIRHLIELLSSERMREMFTTYPKVTNNQFLFTLAEMVRENKI